MSEAETTPAAQELKIYPPPEALAKGAHVSGMAAYEKLCDPRW